MPNFLHRSILEVPRKTHLFSLIILSLFISFCDIPTKLNPEPRPNIILFMVDDLGWTDVSFMGSTYYETPHIDALASEGMVFSNAYANAPNCAPSRASILSGRYPTDHGVYTVGSSERGRDSDRALIPVENTRELDGEYVTIAEYLKGFAYATAHIGKWHLGNDSLSSPFAQGFDINIGGNHAGHPKSYFSPYKNPNLEDGEEGEYLSDRLTDEALAFISINKDQPFFLHFAHYAVHTPIQAKDSLMEKYQRKASSNHHNNPAYAAMIESVDESLGRLVHHLKELGIAEQSLILFFSDNGGHGAITSNLPLRGSKGMLYEGGIRVPMIAWYPDKIKAGSSSEEPVIGLDLYPTFAELASSKSLEIAYDGESLMPLFEDASTNLNREALYWHFPAYLEGYQNIRQAENLINGQWRAIPSGAIRMGDWKLIEYFENGNCQLFNLKEDIGETRDLYQERPEKAQFLLDNMHAWRKANNAKMPMRK